MLRSSSTDNDSKDVIPDTGEPGTIPNSIHKDDLLNRLDHLVTPPLLSGIQPSLALYRKQAIGEYYQFSATASR